MSKKLYLRIILTLFCYFSTANAILCLQSKTELTVLTKTKSVNGISSPLCKTEQRTLEPKLARRVREKAAVVCYCKLKSLFQISSFDFWLLSSCPEEIFLKKKFFKTSLKLCGSISRLSDTDISASLSEARSKETGE